MKLALAFLLAFIPLTLAAQDGILVSRNAVVLSDSLRNTMIQHNDYGHIPGSVDVFSITYLSDGLRIRGYLATPKAPGRYPVLIFNRGGNRDFGALSDYRATAILGKMASWGYVVLASNYRGGGGSEGMEEFGGRDVHDILNLIPVAAGNPKADTSRIGVYGYSRGGMMTYLLLKEHCFFDAAIVGAGLANLQQSVADRPEMETHVYAELIPGYESRKETELQKRSAVFWAGELCKKTPLLIMHGSSDWRVAPTDALTMASELYAHKHPFRLLFLEGADHGLSEYRSLVWRNVREFFDHYVRDQAPLPNMEPHGR